MCVCRDFNWLFSFVIPFSVNIWTRVVPTFQPFHPFRAKFNSTRVCVNIFDQFARLVHVFAHARVSFLKSQLMQKNWFSSLMFKNTNDHLDGSQPGPETFPFHFFSFRLQSRCWSVDYFIPKLTKLPFSTVVPTQWSNRCIIDQNTLGLSFVICFLAIRFPPNATGGAIVLLVHTHCLNRVCGRFFC